MVPAEVLADLDQREAGELAKEIHGDVPGGGQRTGPALGHQIFWFEPERNAAQFERIPIWIWQIPERGDFFGTPHLKWPGAKVGKHHSDVFVEGHNLAALEALAEVLSAL